MSDPTTDKPKAMPWGARRMETCQGCGLLQTQPPSSPNLHYSDGHHAETRYRCFTGATYDQTGKHIGWERWVEKTRFLMRLLPVGCPLMLKGEVALHDEEPA
jgi:hypothetical protein